MPNAEAFTDGKIMVEDNRDIQYCFCNLCGTKIKKKWLKGIGMICGKCAKKFKDYAKKKTDYDVNNISLEKHYAQEVCRNLKLKEDFSETVLDIVKICDINSPSYSKQAESIAEKLNYENNKGMIDTIPRIIDEWKQVVNYDNQ